MHLLIILACAGAFRHVDACFEAMNKYGRSHTKQMNWTKCLCLEHEGLVHIVVWMLPDSNTCRY